MVKFTHFHLYNKSKVITLSGVLFSFKHILAGIQPAGIFIPRLMLITHTNNPTPIVSFAAVKTLFSLLQSKLYLAFLYPENFTDRCWYWLNFVGIWNIGVHFNDSFYVIFRNSVYSLGFMKLFDVAVEKRWILEQKTKFSITLAQTGENHGIL